MNLTSIWNSSHSSLESPITPLDQRTTHVMSSLLLTLTIVFLLLYSHVFYILVGKRLWNVHSFFLWFVSLSLCDIGNLMIYSWSSITVIDPSLIPRLESSVYLGHVYNFLFLNAFFHFPFMAVIRTAGIAWPLRTRRYLTTRWTWIQIVGAWTLSLLCTIYIQNKRGNWVYFDTRSIGWNYAFEDLYDSDSEAFWICMPTLSVVISFIMYSICVYKLRKHTTQIIDTTHTPAAASNNTQHSVEAERNLIKINIMLFLVFSLDMIFWRVQNSGEQLWWTPYGLTLVEVVMYGLNAVVLLGVSREIRKRSLLCQFIAKCRCILNQSISQWRMPGAAAAVPVPVGGIHHPNLNIPKGANFKNRLPAIGCAVTPGNIQVCGDVAGPSSSGLVAKETRRFFPRAAAINLFVEKWSQVKRNNSVTRKSNGNGQSKI